MAGYEGGMRGRRKGMYMYASLLTALPVVPVEIGSRPHPQL